MISQEDNGSRAVVNSQDHLSLRKTYSADLDVIDNYPGWERAPDFLQKEITARQSKRVADLGGGANPMLRESFISAAQIEYCVLDISQEELAKAPDYCEKLHVDITAPAEEFSANVRRDQFDLAFSHMFLEHVKTPMAAHRNIHSMLRPGGIAIHFYPSPNNIPLGLNRLMPESVSNQLVRIAQPQRDLAGFQVKFPAYYRMCGNPSVSLHRRFEEIGYSVLQHTGYIGHGYYSRFPVLRDFEAFMRGVLRQAGIPLTSAILLVLQKR